MAWMGLARHGTENPWHGWTLARHGTENPMAWMDPGTAWHGKPVGMDGPTSYVVPMVNFKNFSEFWHLFGGPEKDARRKMLQNGGPEISNGAMADRFGPKTISGSGVLWHGMARICDGMDQPWHGLARMILAGNVSTGHGTPNLWHGPGK